jgi:Sigma-70, region 4
VSKFKHGAKDELILRLREEEGKTFKSIGAGLGITLERARQIYYRAVRVRFNRRTEAAMLELALDLKAIEDWIKGFQDKHVSEGHDRSLWEASRYRNLWVPPSRSIRIEKKGT